MKTICLSLSIIACLMFSSACKSGANLPTRKPPITVYVTNEASGNLSRHRRREQRGDRDPAPGKRPRGIYVTPDKKSIFVALSGSPIAARVSTKTRCFHRIKEPTASESWTLIETLFSN
jgi:hypothetical protein